MQSVLRLSTDDIDSMLKMKTTSGCDRLPASIVLTFCVLSAFLHDVESLWDEEAIFYPFGYDVRDTEVPRSDDGSSFPLNVSINFPFFGNPKTTIYVNVNGLISFESPLNQFTPAPFPLFSGHRGLIAPYWSDVDMTSSLVHGTIYYRQTTTTAAGLLARASDDVRAAFQSHGFGSFTATWAFVATWLNVTYLGGTADSPTNSFQAVLITDGRDSFVVFNYGRLTWTTGATSGGDNGFGGTPAQVGFDSGDLENYYTVPGSLTADVIDMERTSNIGVAGRWMFLVSLQHIVLPGGCNVRTVDVGTCLFGADQKARTFDQRAINYRGNCKVVLASSCRKHNGDGPPVFEVFGRNEYRSGVVRLRYVEIVYGGATVRMSMNNQKQSVAPPVRVTLNNASISVPYCSVGDFSIFQQAGKVRFQTSFGLAVDFDRYNDEVSIGVPMSVYGGKLCGLCGNHDGIAETENGRPALVEDSYFVTDPENADRQLCQITSNERSDEIAPRNSVDTAANRRKFAACDVLRNTSTVFGVCAGIIGFAAANNYSVSCLVDAVQSQGSSVCRSVRDFVEECSRAGVIFGPSVWRQLTKCPLVCPEGMIYNPNALPCQPACVNPSAEYTTCSRRRTEMCVCPRGQLLDNGKCTDKCPTGCVDSNQQPRVVGEYWAGVDCTTVRCVECPSCEHGAQIRVDTTGCPPGAACVGQICVERSTCRVHGAGHIQTFDGAFFDYYGSCRRQLTATCYRGQKASPYFEMFLTSAAPTGSGLFLSTVEINFESDTIKFISNQAAITVIPADVMINGIRVGVPFTTDQYEISYVGLAVRFDSLFGLSVYFDGVWSTTIQLPTDRLAGTVCGICGNNDGDVWNDWTLSNGTSVAGLSDAGTLVGDSYVDVDLDTDLEKCYGSVVPDVDTWPPDPRCGPLDDESGILGKCVRVALDSPLAARHYEACALDSVLTGGRSVCHSLRTFVEECRRRGLGGDVNCTDWQTATNCDTYFESRCPAGTNYSCSAAACRPACSPLRPSTCLLQDTDACVCPAGQLLLSGQCVNSCFGCHDSHSEFHQFGDNWNETGCRTATCVMCADCSPPYRGRVEFSSNCAQSSSVCVNDVCVAASTTSRPTTESTLASVVPTKLLSRRAAKTRPRPPPAKPVPIIMLTTKIMTTAATTSSSSSSSSSTSSRHLTNTVTPNLRSNAAPITSAPSMSVAVTSATTGNSPHGGASQRSTAGIPIFSSSDSRPHQLHVTDADPSKIPNWQPPATEVPSRNLAFTYRSTSVSGSNNNNIGINKGSPSQNKSDAKPKVRSGYYASATSGNQSSATSVSISSTASDGITSAALLADIGTATVHNMHIQKISPADDYTATVSQSDQSTNTHDTKIQAVRKNTVPVLLTTDNSNYINNPAPQLMNEDLAVAQDRHASKAGISSVTYADVAGVATTTDGSFGSSEHPHSDTAKFRNRNAAGSSFSSSSIGGSDINSYTTGMNSEFDTAVTESTIQHVQIDPELLPDTSIISDFELTVLSTTEASSRKDNSATTEPKIQLYNLAPDLNSVDTVTQTSIHSDLDRRVVKPTPATVPWKDPQLLSSCRQQLDQLEAFDMDIDDCDGCPDGRKSLRCRAECRVAVNMRRLCRAILRLNEQFP